MTPTQMYTGPQALGFSKYASSIQPQSVPAMFTSATARTTDNTIATREQIMATSKNADFTKTPSNADAELAITQGHALQEEVEKHAANFSKMVSSAVINTRQLLALIRESLQKENVTDLHAVDELWAELEQLFTAANATKAVMPAFLEKQRNSMSLYHASMLNETIRENQNELNTQYKKVNIQHDLILEHEEAFRDYKAQTAAKIKQLTELQERCSRLTLEKGNFRTEVDKYKHILELERATKAEDLKNVDILQKELETLAGTKQQLLGEIDTLQKTIVSLQEKMETVEQRTTDRFVAELKEKTEELAKEIQKSTGLSSVIAELTGTDGTAKMEAEKVKQENKQLAENYKNQAAEHAEAFTKLKEQTLKICALKANVELLHKENVKLLAAKERLTQQITDVTTELNATKRDSTRANLEVDSLKTKLKNFDEEVENLKIEKNNMFAKQAEMQKTLAALQILQSENTNLTATINELKAKGAFPVASASSLSGKERLGFEAKISKLEHQKTGLETALREWTDLATRSYQEYKELLPTYKQADQYRKDVLAKDQVITDLKAELSAAKASPSNGVGATNDGAYWKLKYESLLETVGG